MCKSICPLADREGNQLSSILKKKNKKKQNTSNIWWLYLLLVFVLSDSDWRVFVVGWTKETIWRRHFDIFNLYTRTSQGLNVLTCLSKPVWHLWRKGKNLSARRPHCDVFEGEMWPLSHPGQSSHLRHHQQLRLSLNAALSPTQLVDNTPINGSDMIIAWHQTCSRCWV